MTDVNVVLLVNCWTQAYIMPFTVQYRAERLVLNDRIALWHVICAGEVNNCAELSRFSIHWLCVTIIVYSDDEQRQTVSYTKTSLYSRPWVPNLQEDSQGGISGFQCSWMRPELQVQTGWLKQSEYWPSEHISLKYSHYCRKCQCCMLQQRDANAHVSAKRDLACRRTRHTFNSLHIFKHTFCKLRMHFRVRQSWTGRMTFWHNAMRLFQQGACDENSATEQSGDFSMHLQMTDALLLLIDISLWAIKVNKVCDWFSRQIVEGTTFCYFWRFALEQ